MLILRIDWCHGEELTGGGGRATLGVADELLVILKFGAGIVLCLITCGPSLSEALGYAGNTSGSSDVHV